jgi:tellurite resistance protein TerC
MDWLYGIRFVLLALDLGVFHRKAHEVRMKEALIWSVVWISLALVFNLGVYSWFGPERGLEFLTGFLIEKALAVDNIFVFVVLFSYFAVPAALHHKVLFWGILGALIMRAVFIVIGGVLLQKFHWVMYVFGALLLFTGIKLFLQKDAELHPERNPLFRLFMRFMPTLPAYHDGRFFVRQSGRWYATPLFIVLISVEVTDLVFAVDSIPAIFAVTSDPFIVYSSNILRFSAAVLIFSAQDHSISSIISKLAWLFVLAFCRRQDDDCRSGTRFRLGCHLLSLGLMAAPLPPRSSGRSQRQRADATGYSSPSPRLAETTCRFPSEREVGDELSTMVLQCQRSQNSASD